MVAFNTAAQESHPITLAAVMWVQDLTPAAVERYHLRLARLATVGNRLALACLPTLEAIIRGEIVDAFDLVALAWLLLRLETTPTPLVISTSQPPKE